MKLPHIDQLASYNAILKTVLSVLATNSPPRGSELDFRLLIVYLGKSHHLSCMANSCFSHLLQIKGLKILVYDCDVPIAILFRPLSGYIKPTGFGRIFIQEEPSFDHLQGRREDVQNK